MAGRPKGIPQLGRYGVGIKTKSVRVPVELAPKVGDILNAYRDIHRIVREWQEILAHNGVNLNEIEHLSAVQLLSDLEEHLVEEYDN